MASETRDHHPAAYVPALAANAAALALGVFHGPLYWACDAHVLPRFLCVVIEFFAAHFYLYALLSATGTVLCLAYGPKWCRILSGIMFLALAVLELRIYA
jgi:hypothetical protein